MTAEELMNSEKYEPDEGISFEDYYGDSALAVPSMMIEFAQYHVEEALKEALESILCLGSSSDIASYEEVECAILNCYPKENIK